MAEPKQSSPINDHKTPDKWTSRLLEVVRRLRPELAKVRSLVEIKLLQIKLFQEVLKSKHATEATIGASESQKILGEILTAHHNWPRNLDAAHETNHKLNQLLPFIATDDYLYSTLERELKTKEHPEHRFSIITLFDEADITALIHRHRDDSATALKLCRESEAQADVRAQDRRRAEQLLRSLYEFRDERWTYERAVVRLKRYYLMSYAVVVGMLLAIVCMLTILAGGGDDSTRNQLLLVTSAGALGSALAATFKLRDAVARLNDLPAVLVVPFAQALIGASLGFATWLLLMSGVVQIATLADAHWATLALVAFAGGFSEPFTLRLIDRFIGSD